MFVSWGLWSVIGLGSRMGMLIEVYTVESGVGKMANGSAGVTGVTSYFVLQYYSRTSTSATYISSKLSLSTAKIDSIANTTHACFGGQPNENVIVG